MRIFVLCLLLAGCTRHKAEAPAPVAAPAKDAVEDTTDCFHPATLAEFRAVAEAFDSRKGYVEGGKRYACYAPDKVAEGGCYKASGEGEMDRLNGYAKDHGGAFEVAGKVFTCAEAGVTAETPECYVAKTKAEFERLLPRSIEGGLEVDGKAYRCLKMETK